MLLDPIEIVMAMQASPSMYERSSQRSWIQVRLIIYKGGGFGLS